MNRNAQFLAQQLAGLGIPHYYQTVVGDNPQRLKQVIEIAIKRAASSHLYWRTRSNTDDLTTETLADFFNAPLIERPEILADIVRKYAQRGREITPSNRKQALISRRSRSLPNPGGTAPGIIWQPRPGLVILTFPGVPSEMQRMWQETAVPFLKSQGFGKEIIYSRTLKFWGIAESALAEKVSNFLNLPNPTVAPYASLGEVKLRITAIAESEAEARQLIAPVEAELQQIGGLDYYGSDDDSLASVVGQLLLDSGETLSVAESCTGGGLGQMLTDVAGSSGYFLVGVISYDNSVKFLLGVKPEDLAQFGAVSATVAEQMAVGVRMLLSNHLGTKYYWHCWAGGGYCDKPVGSRYIFGYSNITQVQSFEHRFGESTRSGR
jgi:nicotinamide-nucleotide amidase